MYEHTNSVLTAQPHWATTGGQSKGCPVRALVLLVLGGEPRSTQPWSHLKQLLRNGHNHESLGRRCVLAVWICALSPHPPRCNRTGQTGRPPAQSPRRRITRGFHVDGASGTDALHQDDVDGQGQRRRGNRERRSRAGPQEAIGRSGVLNHEVEQMTKQKRGRR